MLSKQLELLVALQDLDCMLKEVEEVKALGFEAPGKEDLEKAREELAKKIEPRLLSTYNRLRKHYKRAIAPVKDNKCLGCFMQLPTSLSVRGRQDDEVITCQGCGRILYWLD